MLVTVCVSCLLLCAGVLFVPQVAEARMASPTTLSRMTTISSLRGSLCSVSFLSCLPLCQRL